VVRAMAQETRLLDINPGLDRNSLALRFAAERRVQIRDVLTQEAAANVHRVLAQETQWGLAWQAAQEGPHNVPEPELRRLPPDRARRMQQQLMTAMAGHDYAFAYSHYPMVHAYLEAWAPGGPHEALLELINDQPFLDLVREVTGLPQLSKADAQATLFAPGQFLATHDDSHMAEGWRVAYVLGMCMEDWRPEWGGYLQFFDEEGDVEAGWKPRFNSLNLFLVPQRHAVTFVPPFAPVARYAITGWFRDL
jgi:Rps23 Pro-64 3,4-dihydroxylase Tpa1-like proline 4-hydroxylase